MITKTQVRAIDATELQSSLQDHVLLLAEAQRREGDETLRPVMAAQQAVQEARLALIDAHFSNDTLAIMQCLERIKTTADTFWSAVIEWRRVPLAQSLVDRLNHTNDRHKLLLEQIAVIQQKVQKGMQSGATPARDDVREFQYAFCKCMHEMATTNYDDAMAVLGYLMDHTPPFLH